MLEIRGFVAYFLPNENRPLLCQLSFFLRFYKDLINPKFHLRVLLIENTFDWEAETEKFGLY